ncbi:hypothetical protein DSP71_00205 [Microbacterium sp. H6]|nr:hypothetical protein DSP71_00205 [Microbacterium sp. H6]
MPFLQGKSSWKPITFSPSSPPSRTVARLTTSPELFTWILSVVVILAVAPAADAVRVSPEPVQPLTSAAVAAGAAARAPTAKAASNPPASAPRRMDFFFTVVSSS